MKYFLNSVLLYVNNITETCIFIFWYQVLSVLSKVNAFSTGPVSMFQLPN